MPVVNLLGIFSGDSGTFNKEVIFNNSNKWLKNKRLLYKPTTEVKDCWIAACPR